MSQYFFDIAGPQDECRDDVGSACANLNVAQCLARRTLCDIAGEHSSCEGPIALTMHVRDLDGVEVYTATLTLTGTRP